MKRFYLGVIFSGVFLFLAALIITSLTTVDKASWLAHTSHISMGILLIFVGTIFMRIFFDTNKHTLIYPAIGFLILGFSNLFMIYYHEYYAIFNAVPSTALFLNAVTNLIGAVFLFLGFKNIISGGSKL